MEQIAKMRRGDTLTGLFDYLKDPGDVVHLRDKDRKRYQSLRTAAYTKNDRARHAKEIKPKQVKFRVLVSLKKGYTSIIYVNHSKE